MASEIVELTYDGDLLKDHKIDVSILAPALQSLGDLLSHANAEINGDRVKSSVLINANFKANCITIIFEYITILAQAAQLTFPFETKDAKKILEWIGILAGASAGPSAEATAGASSLIDFLKFRKNKGEIKNQKTVNINGDNNTVTYFAGDVTYIMPEETHKMLNNPLVKKSLAGIVKPPATIDGINQVKFTCNKTANSINKEDAKAIYDYLSIQNEQPTEELETTVIAIIKIYKPTLEINSKTWTFKYDGDAKVINIEDSNLASIALQNGVAYIGDRFKVNLKRTDPGDGGRLKYKVIGDVIEYLHHEQSQIPFDN